LKIVKAIALAAVTLAALPLMARPAAAEPVLQYWGGPVQRTPHVYLTFWGSNWNQYSGARTSIREMFTGLSGSDWQRILTQYYDTGGPISLNVPVSSWTDQSIGAPNNVNDQNLIGEIEYATAQQGWPAYGINNHYVILPAPGSKYQAGFIEGCAAHRFAPALGSPYFHVGWPGDSYFTDCRAYDPTGEDRAFAAASVLASHEYAETVTNPITPKFAGGYSGWLAATGEEIGNLCAFKKGGQLWNGTWVQRIWSNFQGACVLSEPVQPSWHGPGGLGGQIVGDPDVASWGSGRLDVFARGTTNTLHTKYYSGGSWSGWINLGGPELTSGPGAVSWGSNRIDVVGRASNGTVTHYWYDGSKWSNESLGGSIIGSPDISSWGGGRLDVFAWGSDNTLQHKWFTNGSWSSWESLGGTLTSGPGAVSSGANRIDVVARTTNADVAHWWYDGTWHGDNLGGQIVGEPDISSWGTGRLDVFARGTNDALHHKWFQGSWSGWENKGGILTSGPGAVSWGKDRIDVFGRATDNSVAQWWFGP